jgi:hypothetical protein
MSEDEAYDIAEQYNREELHARSGGGIQDPLFDTFETAFWEFKKQYYVAFMNAVSQKNAANPMGTVSTLNKYISSFNNILNVLASKEFKGADYPTVSAATTLEAAMNAVPSQPIGEYVALIEQFRNNIFNLDRQAKAIIFPNK